jgi:glucose/arabinose dehydrogenase
VCSERTTSLSQPWIRVGLACLEQVIDDAALGDLAFTALAAAPDGSLYAARPFSGEVIRLTDGDGDGLPETPTVAARGLTLPNALAWHRGALYVTGGPHLYRLDPDGTLTTLAADLPIGASWTGGVAVLDGRLYVGVGAACESCAALDGGDPLARGGVVSYALDGSDRRIEAVGLRSPYGLTTFDGALYLTDAAPENSVDPDHVLRIRPGGTSDVIADFPSGSTPTAIAVYNGTAIPALDGMLLVVLNGSRGRVDLRGYQVVAVNPADGSVTDVMPARPDDSATSEFSIMTMNYRGSGFFPRRPIGITVTEAGWVIISISGGRILALRP